MRRRDRLGKVEPVTSVSLPSNAFSRHTSGHPKNGHTQMHTLNSPAVLGGGGEDLVDELWGLRHGGSETSDGSGEHEEVTRWSRIVEQGVGVVGGARDVSERSTHSRWRNWCRSPRNQTTTFKELAAWRQPTLTEADIGTHSGNHFRHRPCRSLPPAGGLERKYLIGGHVSGTRTDTAVGRDVLITV